MTHGSLFSGIGGFDLAAEWMGWENVFHCEWNPFGRKVLKYYWPQSISYNDITKTNFAIHAGAIDILTGGFPCQPYSAAGKRLGKEDERHLWPSMLRAIREISPRYVVGENVRGLTNWNGGMVFDEVQADLEAAGYEVLPFLLPAAGVNAPHRRDRIWFVAYSPIFGKRPRQSRSNTESGQQLERTEQGIYCNDNGKSRSTPNTTETISGNTMHTRTGRHGIAGMGNVGNATDTQGKRMEGNGANREQKPYTHAGQRLSVCSNTGTNWQNFPTQPPVCSGDDGLPTQLDGITFPKWRNESIKAYGNAIVPQVAYQIFKAIQQMEEL